MNYIITDLNFGNLYFTVSLDEIVFFLICYVILFLVLALQHRDILKLKRTLESKTWDIKGHRDECG
jgi:hypothetical protein